MTPAVKNNNKMITISRNRFMKTAILMISVALYVQAGTISWYKAVTSTNFRSSFTLTYASSGSKITSIVNPGDPSATYNVLHWRPGQSHPANTPFQSAGPYSGAQIVNSNTLDTSGMWRIEILPTGPNFMFTVEFKVDNSSVGKFAGLASPNRVFTIYSASLGTYRISLSLSTPTISSLTANLYGPFPTLSYTGGNLIAATAVTTYDSRITYSSNGNAYYYLVIQATDSLYTSAPLLRLGFETDTYQCPFSSDTADYNQVFSGCSTTVPSSGFPCLTFDNLAQKCLTCYDTWVPNQLGVCVQNTNCGPNQYYSFGNCYKVIDNCVNFEKFGGTCNACRDGYKLANNPDGTQLCQQDIPVCTAGQYLLGNACKNFVENCANFISLNATCEACKIGYRLQNNLCIYRPEVNISCPIGQQPINGVCQLIDSNCLFYNKDNICQICAKGFILQSSRCFQVQCGPRQYSVYGNCTDISPTCGQFDKVYGNCLTCINTFYVLQNDGRCVQTLDPNANGIVVITCQPRYYARNGTCVQVNALCEGYDNNTGDCTSCNDPSNYILSNGACVSIQGFCAGLPRTFFRNGECVKISDLCDTFNILTGACLSCRDNTQLNAATGICKYNQICGERQYYLPNGACANVNSNCTTFDPSNGQCTGCIPGLELNVGGICCLSGNYLDNPICVPFLKENCVSNHERFGYCFQCKPGTAKLNNQYMGKCQPIIARL